MWAAGTDPRVFGLGASDPSQDDHHAGEGLATGVGGYRFPRGIVKAGLGKRPSNTLRVIAFDAEHSVDHRSGADADDSAFGQGAPLRTSSTVSVSIRWVRGPTPGAGRTDEPPAITLRAGNAGSNTTTNHKTVMAAALNQPPLRLQNRAHARNSITFPSGSRLYSSTVMYVNPNLSRYSIS